MVSLSVAKGATKSTTKTAVKSTTMNLPAGATKAIAGTVGVAGVGLGLSALAGALPGTEGTPQKIGDFLNNATGGLFNIGSTAMLAAGAVALILLLK